MKLNEELERRFNNPPDRTQAVREAQAAVARWVWTRGESDRWFAEPMWWLRNGFPPGRDYKREPKRRDDVERYGYDQAGALRYAERIKFGEVRQTLIVHSEGPVSLRWEYSYSIGARHGLMWSETDPQTGRVMRSERLTPSFHVDRLRIVEEFSYDAQGRLACVRFERSGGDYDRSVGFRSGEQRIAYGADGQVTSIVAHHDHGKAETVYIRVRESWDELVETVLVPLTEAIASAVADASDELALVAVSYPGDQAALPPIINVCSSRARAELVADHDADRTLLLPPEWREDQIDVTLPASIRPVCEKLVALVEQGHAPAGGSRLLCLAIARGLAVHTWPPTMKRAADFAVYAVDFEGEDLERNLPTSVPKHQIAQWRDRYMLD